MHLLLFSAELSIMRSAFDVAEGQLGQAIATVRGAVGIRGGGGGQGAAGEEGELWTTFKERITLDFGLLALARGEEVRAEECFETVLMSDEAGVGSKGMQKRKSTGGGGGGGGEEAETGQGEKDNLLALAKLSLLLLKIGQGTRVRLSTSQSSSSSSAPSSSSSPTDARLTTLSRSLVALSSSPSSPPSLQLMAEFIQALTKGEITKAKQHLSVALGLANATGQNHAKAVLLGLLGNLFVWTRNDQVRGVVRLFRFLSFFLSEGGEGMGSLGADASLSTDVQAQKMLLAALHIARGLGPRSPPPPPTPSPSPANPPPSSSSSQGGSEVGQARLGLWVGERLVGERALSALLAFSSQAEPSRARAYC